MKKPEKKPLFHKPVLVSEVCDALEADKYAHLKNCCFIDATVGLGGHAKEFVKRGIFTLGIDADESSLKIAEEVLRKACPTPLDKQKDTAFSRGCFKLLHGNFSDIDKLIGTEFNKPFLGILFDLGISSFQLDDPKRGLSFRESDQPLDMRLDTKTQGVKASDLLALLGKRELIRLFAEVLSYDQSVKIADSVVRIRREREINTVGDFLEIVRPLIRKKGKIDSATLPFLALRMAVNYELENLKRGLVGAYKILALGGRMAVISFHSGEDRVVKNYFKQIEIAEGGSIITKKPILPKDDELENNPRARSAKLRVLEKI